MLKLQIIIIIFITLQKSFVHLINPNDFCSLAEKDCVGHYDEKNNYRVDCIHQKCNKSSLFKFECGKDKCAKNEKNCEEYLRLEMNMLYLRKGQFRYRYLVSANRNRETSYTTFQNQIKKCPKRAYVWNARDFCESGRNCFKQVDSRGDFKENRLKRVECLCKEKSLNYVCDGHLYCARNKQACDSLAAKEFKSVSLYESRRLNISQCDNDFILF